MSNPQAALVAAHAGRIKGAFTRLSRTGFVHVLTAQGASRVFVAAQGILLARLLSPDDLGRFALLASALALSGVVGQGGIPSALARYVPLAPTSKDQEELRDGAVIIGVAWSLLVGGIVALPITGQALSKEAWVRAWLRSAVVLVPLQTVTQASLSLLHGQARFPKKSSLETFNAASAFALVVAGTLAGGLSGAAWGRVLGAAIAATAIAASTRIALPRSFHFPSGFWRFAALSLVSASCSTMLHTADTLVLGTLRVSTSDIGAYRVASLLYAFLAMVPAAAMHTLFPRLVRVHETPPALRRLCVRSLRYLVGGGVLAAASAVVVAPLLVTTIAGSAYERSIPFVRILGVGLVFRAVVLWAGTVILAMGRPGLNLALLVLTGTVTLALDVLLVAAYGPVGAAWATVASEVVSAVSGGIAVWRLLGVRPRV